MKKIIIVILTLCIIAIGYAIWRNQRESEAVLSVESGQARTREILLYYYNAENDKDDSGNVMCGAQGLVAVARQIPISQTPIRDAIDLLIKGKLADGEIEAGVATEFPLQGLELKGANLKDGTLTLEFADPQNKTNGGSCRVAVLRAQIEATAKQFGGVEEVHIIPEELFQP